MLGKLIKYEIKSIYKYFLVLYAVIIAGAFTSYGTISASSGLLSKLGFSSFILCIFAMMALGVLLLIFTITRFNTSLLGDEGYLMFTVPTSTHNIIWSKAIAILIFDVLSVLIVCLVMGGYIYFVGDLNFANLDKEVVEIHGSAEIVYLRGESPNRFISRKEIIQICLLVDGNFKVVKILHDEEIPHRIEETLKIPHDSQEELEIPPFLRN